MTSKQKAQQLYCELHSHTQNKVKLIEAILEGLTPSEIVSRRIAPCLSIATIYNTFNQLKKLLANKETK